MVDLLSVRRLFFIIWCGKYFSSVYNHYLDGERVCVYVLARLYCTRKQDTILPASLALVIYDGGQMDDLDVYLCGNNEKAQNLFHHFPRLLNQRIYPSRV